ncbi:MAG TPA: signal peptide peptidase SppA [Pyrinomonadaceae bacterium]|nr:signal peptide peptidase SppA [Pyrinomonadaceae bacterium]
MAMSGGRKALLIIGGIILAVVLVSIIGIALIVASLGSGPSIENNSVLVLKVSGDLPDFAAEDPTAKLFGMEPQTSFASILTQLRKAKVDKRVGGILLDINFPGIGWGKADELREAINDFRDSGKPIYAYMELGTNKEYYIATAADKIFLPPTGDIYINGFAAQSQFYKGSLDKLGIEWEDVHVGKYKSANEPFTRKDHSPESREVVNAILDDYLGRMVNVIAETRKKSPEDVKAIIDNAPYNAVQAQQIGLIDGAKYRDEVNNEFKTRLGYKESDELSLTTTSTYREVTPESLGLNNGERIAVIFASGLITTGKSADGTFGGAQTIGSDTIVRAVKEAADDTSIKAIVLRVDSGGGSALASDLMWHTLEYAKSKKPVVTSMGDVAASGGYYIAANSHKIVAEPSTITGSIGVVLGRPAIGGLYEWLGVTNEYTTRGKNSGLFREDRKWTDEEREVFQKSANFFYWDNFVPKVAQGRGRTVEQIHEVAQGRVWTGSQAKDRGLVDEFGGLNKAVEIAKQLANLPAEKDVKRVVFPVPRPFFESLFSSGDEEATVSAKEKAQQQAILNALPKDVRKLFRYSALFDQMRRGEALAMMPFELEIR